MICWHQVLAIRYEQDNSSEEVKFYLHCLNFLETGLDVTYNSRRGILGAIPVSKETAYHLFNIDANAPKAGDIVKLYRKSKWHSQHSNATCNWLIECIFDTDCKITGLDFNPTGEYVATIDENNHLLNTLGNLNLYSSLVYEILLELQNKSK